LGVDTFAQELIKLDTRTIELQDGASFGLSRRYHHGAIRGMMQEISRRCIDITRFDRQEADILLTSTKSVDVAMEGAVFRGFYNLTVSPEFDCSSRCVWKSASIS
jgi:hypothetical protein